MQHLKLMGMVFLLMVLAGILSAVLAADVRPPSQPTNLKASVVSTSQINLTWTSSRDNVRVSGYRVYRNNSFIGQTSSPAYGNTGLNPGTNYTYQVQAVDTSGNLSIKSKAVTATTLITTTSAIGFVGCSMTVSAVNGAELLGYTNFWTSDTEYGGGGVWQWAKDLNGDFWQAFQANQNNNPVSVVWWNLCSLGSDEVNETLTNAKVVLDEIKRRIPGVTVYVSAQPAYNPGSYICSIAGATGPARMATLARDLQVSGEALAGPVMGPLDAPGQLKDSCHPNTEGKELLGQQLISFFE